MSVSEALRPRCVDCGRPLRRHDERFPSCDEHSRVALRLVLHGPTRRAGDRGRITEADVGRTLDLVTVRRAPDPGCYGCNGTGRLWWAGITPTPCSCVTHTTNCEPGCCVCPEDCEECGAGVAEVAVIDQLGGNRAGRPVDPVRVNQPCGHVA